MSQMSFLTINVIADLVASGGRYAEPSIRPDDSRYGENPNRLQRHTQFQVSSGSTFTLHHIIKKFANCLL